MNKILLILFSIFTFCGISQAQSFIFFIDSPASGYYDPSFGFANSPSNLELINQNKFPVDTTYVFSGSNSLRLHWTSKQGGDWGMAVAASGWTGHNVYQVDSISFMAYSTADIDSSQLPVIFIEDLNNTKTPKQFLSEFVNGIKANKWQQVFVPLSVFKNNKGNTDLTKIKTIYFGQGTTDGIEHTIYLDDVKMVKSSTGSNAVSTPAGVAAKGYDSHIELSWNANPESNIVEYNIYRLQDTTYKLIGISQPDIRYYEDFLGGPGITGAYKITAVSLNGMESAMSDSVTTATYQMTDDEFLTMLEQATFRYFWDYAHPVSGLARERLGSGNTVTTGGSGFGVMAILVGIKRGFITREDGTQRILKILNFLSSKANRFHGAFPHWMNGNTGDVIPFSTYDDGGDLVETAFMTEGLLTARQFFNQNTVEEDSIRSMITNIWQSVEWNWYQQDSTGYTLYWHWSPDYGWKMNFPIRGFNEAMIVYLLATASPTHSVPKYDYFIGWSGYLYANGKSFYGIPLYVGQDYGGPLFFTHYSFLGFDPRNIKDKFTNYFVNNRNQTLINRAYCIDNPHHFAGYDSVTWGLTASDDPNGYDAHSPTNDNGTITPTAALSSMPYTPEESIAALKNMYRKYGKKIWGPFGFTDAFNVSKNWYANSYLSIDEGPIIDMIENYRSQLLWNNFMANPEIQPMLDKLGFVKDETGIAKDKSIPHEFVLEGNYPNPFNPGTTIKFELPYLAKIEVSVYNTLGQKIITLINKELPAGENEVVWNGINSSGHEAPSGIYIYNIITEGKWYSGKMILLR